VALQFFSAGLAQKAGIPVEEARKRAVAALVPGVTLQPSGVFACVRAQQEGCAYVRSS
jgi:intracellular sulfur oxidation DsrE/DsrF family protein